MERIQLNNGRLNYSQILSAAFIFCVFFLLVGCSNPAISNPTGTTIAASSAVKYVTVTPGPSPTPANCLVGIWEVKDRQSYLYASVPVGAFQPSDLKFMGTVGSVGMRFMNDGTISVQAENFMGRFDAKVSGEINILDITMNGYVKGQYQLNGEKLSIVSIQRNEMTYKAMLGEETMMDEKQASKFLPLFVEPYTLSTVTCDDKILTIEIVNFPSYSGPLEFTRLR